MHDFSIFLQKIPDFSHLSIRASPLHDCARKGGSPLINNSFLRFGGLSLAVAIRSHAYQSSRITIPIRMQNPLFFFVGLDDGMPFRTGLVHPGERLKIRSANAANHGNGVKDVRMNPYGRAKQRLCCNRESPYSGADESHSTFRDSSSCFNAARAKHARRRAHPFNRQPLHPSRFRDPFVICAPPIPRR